MRKRVSIVRTLVDDSVNVILMDEPFGPLDAQTRVILQDELLRLWHGTGRTIIFVTHDIVEAIALSDRIATFTSMPGSIKDVREVTLRVRAMCSISTKRRDFQRSTTPSGPSCATKSLRREARMPMRDMPIRPTEIPAYEQSLLLREERDVRTRARSSAIRIHGLRFLALVVFLGGWWAASGTLIDSLFFSDPLSIAKSLVRIAVDGSLWWHLERPCRR